MEKQPLIPVVHRNLVTNKLLRCRSRMGVQDASMARMRDLTPMSLALQTNTAIQLSHHQRLKQPTTSTGIMYTSMSLTALDEVTVVPTNR